MRSRRRSPCFPTRRSSARSGKLTLSWLAARARTKRASQRPCRLVEPLRERSALRARHRSHRPPTTHRTTARTGGLRGLRVHHRPTTRKPTSSRQTAATTPGRPAQRPTRHLPRAVQHRRHPSTRHGGRRRRTHRRLPAPLTHFSQADPLTGRPRGDRQREQAGLGRQVGGGPPSSPTGGARIVVQTDQQFEFPEVPRPRASYRLPSVVKRRARGVGLPSWRNSQDLWIGVSRDLLITS